MDRPRCMTSFRIAASAKGERQILPVHMKRKEGLINHPDILMAIADRAMRACHQSRVSQLRAPGAVRPVG